jgi:hypothetical protein
MAHKMKHHHKHHSDPIVGGESEHEGRAWGHGEHANMPKEVKMSMYPKAHEAGPMVEDDTMGRVDKENSRAHAKTRSYLSNQH